MQRLGVLFLLSGCAVATAGAGAPVSPLDRFGTYRNAVEYELQARVRAEACASANVRDAEDKHTIDKSAISNGYLYEKAKLMALDTAKDADGLIEIRGIFQLGNDGNECVVVTGRPYRVVSMRAVPGVESKQKAEATANGIMSPTVD